MKFLISGGSSALAQAVAQRLVLQGNEVSLIGRTTQIPFYLESPDQCLQQHLDFYDFFLHFAHSFDYQRKPDLNESAAHKILVATENSGIKKCVYISSDSASENAKSMYGQSKYRTERIFLPSKKWVVLRIGIIVDDMIPSPYQLVRKFVKTTRILIAPNPNKANFSTTTIQQVVQSLVDSCKSNLTGGPFSVQPKPESVSLLCLLEQQGTKPKIILKIPYCASILLWSIGKNFKCTRRIVDSIMSTLIDREQIRGFPE
jgi:nucleoside-diphosphate-sugar epimerase